MQGRISVISTEPSSSAINVSVKSSITITFDRDVSKRSLAGNIHVLSSHGDKIDCIISSAGPVITITPRTQLPAADSITVVLKGNNDPSNVNAVGIMSPYMDYMLGDYTYSFSTISAIKETERVVNMSPDNICLEKQPILKGDITNDTISVAKYIDIEISKSNTFESALSVWSGRCTIEEFATGIACDIFLPNGAYYWRARTVCEVNGEWCGCCSFAIDDHADAKVVAEDHIDVDVAFPKTWDMLDAKVESIYPSDKRSGVPNNLKTISIVLDQIVPEEELRYASLSITGEGLDETEVQEISLLDADVSIVYDHDENKTILVISLAEIIDEEETEAENEEGETNE